MIDRIDGIRIFAQPRPMVVQLLLGLGVPLILAGTGCYHAPEKLPANEIPVVDLATPQDASRTILMLIQAELKAIALGDRASLVAIRERELQAVDLAGIRSNLNQNARLQNALGENPALGLVNIWGAMIAYYTDIIEYDGATKIPGTSPDSMTLRVPARSKTSETQIDVVTLRGADGLWRVTRIGFAPKAAEKLTIPLNQPPAAESQPATKPAASTSAPTTSPGPGG